MASAQLTITTKFDGAIFYARLKHLAKLLHELKHIEFLVRHFPSWLPYAK